MRHKLHSPTDNTTALVLLVLSVASIITSFPQPVHAPDTPTLVRFSEDPIQRSVGSTFDVFVLVDDVRDLNAHAGMVQYNQLVLTATAASANAPGTFCHVPSGGVPCDPPAGAVNLFNPGQVRWEAFGTAGFTGSIGLVQITFRVDAKDTTDLLLRSNPDSPPVSDDPKTGETDQVALIELGTFVDIPSREDDGTFYVNPPKSAPVAELLPNGPIKVVAGEKVTFDGGQSSDTNTPPQLLTRYNFTVDGQTVQSGSATIFSFTSSEVGPHTVCLIVVNESGMESSPDCTSITVNQPKLGPTAVLNPQGPLKITLGETVNFDGASSSDNNNPPQQITLYNFTVNSATAQSGPSANFAFSPASAGIYSVCLVVRNESGLSSAPDCTDVLANPPGKSGPTAVLNPPGPVKITPGEQVAFDGSASFDSNNPPQQLIRYNFTVDGETVQSGSSTTFNFIPTSDGTFSICLVVLNESMLPSLPDCTEVNVNPPKTSPVAELLPNGPIKVVAGEKVTFDGSQSSDTNTPPQLLTRYNFTVDGQTVQSGIATIFSFTSSEVGPHTVCLIVVNESGIASSTDCTNITVNIIVHDLAVASVTASASVVERGRPVTITVNVANEGNVDENFQLIVTAGEFSLPTQSLSLARGVNQDFSVTWRTDTAARATHQIRATIVLDSDSDSSDNTRLGPSVTVQVHDVRLVNASVSRTTINIGESVIISVIVENTGDFAETVTLTLSVEGQALPSQSTSLQPGQEKTINFTWTATGISAGTYGYEANIQGVSGDLDNRDNVILAPDAVQVLSVQQPAAPLIDTRLAFILAIVLALLVVGVLIRIRGRPTREQTSTA